MENQSSTDPLNIGIIGVQPDRSWAAIAHIPALLSLGSQFKILAIANTSEASAKSAAKHFNIPRAYGSVDKLCADPDIDIIAVTVKVPHHFDLVHQVIAAGKHVYCEWPLGASLTQAKAMEQAANKAGVIAVCGTQALRSPVFMQVKDLLVDGYIGDILSSSLIGSGMAWGEYTDAPNAYTNDVTNAATMLSIPVGHTLQAVCDILGEYSNLSARLINRRKSSINATNGETVPMTTPDQVLIIGELQNGVPLSVHYRGGMIKGTGLLWEINGTKGDLQIRSAGGHAQFMDLELYAAGSSQEQMEKIETPDQYLNGQSDIPMIGNIARIYADMANDIKNKTQTAPNFTMAVTRHKMLDAVEKSAQDGGKPVFL